MKTIDLHQFLKMTLMLPLCLLTLYGCEEKTEGPDKPNEKPDPVPETWAMKVTAASPSFASEIVTTIAPGSQVDTEYKSHWSDDASISVWVRQDNNLIYVDQVKPTRMMEDGGKALYDLTVNDQVDTNKPFDVYGMSCIVRQEANALYFKNELNRGGSFGIIFKTPGKKGSAELMGQIAGISERLYVINKTDKAIQFRHKGFSAEKVWYYTNAEVSVDDGTVINTEQGAEVVSTVIDVPPFSGKNPGKLTSHYFPNGNKIVDAQLIAEIDGKEVRSVNRLSSDLVLQANHCYAMFATWDGERLVIGDESGDVGLLEIPADAGIPYDEIQVLADGKETAVSSDGHFDADVSSLVALHNDKVVYISYGAGETDRSLNATETAISLLLPMLPLTVTDMEEDMLWVLKQMIGHLDQVKDLAAAIDDCIVDRGYMDPDVITPRLAAACEELKRRLGLDSMTGSGANGPFHAPAYPYFTSTASNKDEADGFYLTIKESKLVNENGSKYWKCTVDLLSGDRFCYTSFTKGYKGPDGYYRRLDDSISDTFRTLVKPMNLSAFMDFGTLSDLATKPKEYLNSLSKPEFNRVVNQFWEPLKNLGHIIKGEETETVTYDKIKVSDIEMRLYGANEHFMIVGPGLDGNLLMFNIIKIVFQPALKLVMGEVKKTDEYKNDKDLMDKLIIGFVEWLGKADLTFRAELLATFTDSNLSWGERLSIFPKIEERFEDFLLEEGLKYLSKVSFDYMFSTGKGTGFDDPTVKAIFAVYKTLLVAGDMLQFLLDNGYRGVGFEITQGQYDTDGGLGDVPGSDL